MANENFNVYKKSKIFKQKFGVDSGANELANRITIPASNAPLRNGRRPLMRKSKFANKKNDLGHRIKHMNNQGIANPRNNKQVDKSQTLAQRIGNGSKISVNQRNPNFKKVDDEKKTSVSSSLRNLYSDDETSSKPLPIFFYLENLHESTTKQEVQAILEKYITKVKYLKMKTVNQNGDASVTVEVVFKTVSPNHQMDKTNEDSNDTQVVDIEHSPENVTKNTSYMLNLITEAVKTFHGVEADGKVLSCGFSYGVSKLITVAEWEVIKETL